MWVLVQNKFSSVIKEVTFDIWKFYGYKIIMVIRYFINEVIYANEMCKTLDTEQDFRSTE